MWKLFPNSLIIFPIFPQFPYHISRFQRKLDNLRNHNFHMVCIRPWIEIDPKRQVKQNQPTLIKRALMCSSYRNCEKMKNFFLRNWYVKFTVVFIMPLPCVRIEFAMCRMLIVFKCLLFEPRSTKIYIIV